MVIKIRFSNHSSAWSLSSLNRQFALACASFLTPVSLMAWALGCWRLGADLNWMGEFAISEGIFSRWQVWMGLGILLQGCAVLLHRHARREEYGQDDAAVS